MPELPEVETVARGVDQHLRGDRIVRVWLTDLPQPFKTPPARMGKVLAGRAILAVHRTGKHIVFELSAPGEKSAPATAQWIVHLGMTGRLLVAESEQPLAPHTHARLGMASGRELRFVDPRRFGRLQFLDLGRTQPFQAPGAEPLTIGVGNIYADESLFRAGIRPSRRANRLTGAELERLRQALRQILKRAIRLGGSSVSDYVDADGERGFFQLEHCVYQRTGQPCRHCQTPIRRILLAGRGTHYCPKCQH